MALSEAEELELLELEALEAQSAEQPARRKSAAGRGEAALRGVTSGLFGAGDVASAAGDAVGAAVIRPLLGKKPLPVIAPQPTIEDLIREEQGLPTPRERLGSFGRVRAHRKQLESDYPVSSGAGNVAGALAPTSLTAQVLNRLGLGIKAGQPIANTGRTAVQGAAEGALTEAALGGDAEDILKAGSVSGVLSPVTGGVIRAGGQATQAVRSIFDKNKDAGFRQLAKALEKEGRRVAPNELKKAADEFKKATGRYPTVVELVGERGGQDIAEAVQSAPRAQETILNAAEQRAQELQGNLSDQISGGRVSTGAPRLLERRGASMDAFMNRKDRFGRAGRNLGERDIALDEEAVNILLEPDTVRLIPPQARKALYDVQEGEAGAISLRDLDNIRQAFRKAGKAGGEAARFSELADIVRDIGIEDVPEYGAALGEFQRRSELVEGLRLGEKVRSAPAKEFAQELAPRTAQAPNRASPSKIAGARVGARQELAETAASSPRNAAETARSLAEDASLQQRLRTLDPEEATRLQRLGAAETEALRSIGGSVRGTRISSASQEEAENLKSVIEAAVLSSGRASGGFQANFATRLVNRFKVPPTAAQKLAEAVTDPARTDEAIDILIRSGVPPKAITELAQAAARATSRTAGPASTEDQ